MLSIPCLFYNVIVFLKKSQKPCTITTEHLCSVYFWWLSYDGRNAFSQGLGHSDMTDRHISLLSGDTIITVIWFTAEGSSTKLSEQWAIHPLGRHNSPYLLGLSSWFQGPADSSILFNSFFALHHFISWQLCKTDTNNYRYYRYLYSFSPWLVGRSLRHLCVSYLPAMLPDHCIIKDSFVDNGIPCRT